MSSNCPPLAGRPVGGFGKTKTLSRLGSLAVALAWCIPNSQAAGAGGATAGLRSEGYRLASSWCQTCHAIEPHMAGSYDGAPSFEAIANRHGTTALSLKVFLKTNHQNMPNLVISPEQADALVAYILSLTNR